MRVVIADPKQEVVYSELAALLAKHRDKVTPIEILAIAANMVGKIIAMQDQRGTSPELAMETVLQNIVHGNRSVIDLLSKPGGKG